MITMVLVTACSGVNIEDELSVMKDIQGTWVGYEGADNYHRFIKVSIKDNRFEGWMQVTDSAREPAWAVLPNEMGTFSISSVLQNDTGKYRSFRFFMQGRCCGDNSLTARTLSQLITYNDKKGLIIRNLPMTKVQ